MNPQALYSALMADHAQLRAQGRNQEAATVATELDALASLVNAYAHAPEGPRLTAATFWCPSCKQTSVADMNDDGTFTCPHCGN